MIKRLLVANRSEIAVRIMATASVRRFGAMFVAGARLTVPVCAVLTDVLRRAAGDG